MMETLVAIFVVSTVLLCLAYVQSAGLLTTSAARQRQQAAQLATQAMEQVRAMPHVKLLAGLSSADPTFASDPNVVDGMTRLHLTSPSEIDEPLVITATRNQAPLDEHQQDVTIGPAVYRVQTYVTREDGHTAAGDPMWVTIVASRVSGPSRGPKPVVLRSKVFSPDGCLSTSTRPFSGPCQAYFHGSAGTTQGRIWVEGEIPGTAESGLAPEFGVRDAQLLLPSVSVTNQAEQTTSVQGRASTAGVKGTLGITDLDPGTVTELGQRLAEVTVDSDPASSEPDDPRTATESQSGTAAVTSTGSFGTLTMTPSGTGSAAVMSGMYSTPGTPCTDPDGDTAAENLGLPCGTAAVGALAAQSLSVTPAAGSSHSLNSFSLASLAPPAMGSPGTAWAARLIKTQNGHCPGLTATGTVGCAAVEASRRLGDLVVGGLPTIHAVQDTVIVGGVPTDSSTFSEPFTGMVKVVDYYAQAGSERGVSTSTAPFTRAGTLRYWTGTGYQDVALGTAAVAPVALGPLVVEYHNGGFPIRFTVTGSVSAGEARAVTTESAECAEVCTTRTEVPSVVVRINYTVTEGMAALGAFSVNADLGTVLASSSYRKTLS
jgi:hypothetical protein